MDDGATTMNTESGVTHRTVIQTGAKIAYAAPMVAATFKLSNTTAFAISPTCVPGTCAVPVKCGELCGCREIDGIGYCLLQQRCSESKVCGPDVICPEGYVCLINSCCRDTLPRCVAVCGTTQGTFKSSSSSDGDDDLVLGPNL